MNLFLFLSLLLILVSAIFYCTFISFSFIYFLCFITLQIKSGFWGIIQIKMLCTDSLSEPHASDHSWKYWFVCWCISAVLLKQMSVVWSRNCARYRWSFRSKWALSLQPSVVRPMRTRSNNTELTLIEIGTTHSFMSEGKSSLSSKKNIFLRKKYRQFNLIRMQQRLCYETPFTLGYTRCAGDSNIKWTGRCTSRSTRCQRAEDLWVFMLLRQSQRVRKRALSPRRRLSPVCGVSQSR